MRTRISELRPILLNSDGMLAFKFDTEWNPDGLLLNGHLLTLAMKRTSIDIF